MTLAPVEALVRDRIGLDPAALGASALARAVGRRMEARGLADAPAYAGLLTADHAEWAALVGELVVHETWFFRGGRAYFDALARWVGGRRPGRPVRVLSVPCSTGEEPYSLALALDAAGVPAGQYQIDGVELARDHLLRAVAARYAAFSFREPGPDPRPRYFRETDDGRWELCPDVRGRVRFRPGNLVDPDFLAAESPYDLILCRNLFIYLTDDGRRRAVANLDRLLAADGRLCLTPAEADRLPLGRFVPDGSAGASVYVRAPGKATPGPKSGVQAVPVRLEYEHAPLTTPAVTRLSGVVPVPPPARVAAPPPVPARGPEERGRELADAGELDRARAVCEEAIAAAAPTAGVLSLLGVIHLAAGRPGDATDAFRKALYLAPDHAEALTHMVVLCEQRGDPAQAAAYRRRLDRLERGAPA